MLELISVAPPGSISDPLASLWNMAKKILRKASKPPVALKFTKVNAMLGGAGLICLALGYGLLAQGSITAAPLLLVLAYLVLLPMAIIK